MMKHALVLALATLVAIPGITPRTASAAAPDVVAEQWVIVDGPSGTVMAAHDPDTPRGMASLTKVMTAVVALERGHLDMRVKITQGDKVPESSAGLYVGTTPTLRTLLHALLLPSGNDAAMAIARSVGGSASFESAGARQQFVGWMNDKAAELSMVNTRFQNPHGLDEDGHFSTPADMAILVRYALELPGFREIIGATEYHGDGYSFYQTNQLPYLLDGVVGGKTGWTDDCGRCLIEVVHRDGRDLIVVLFGSNLNWYADAMALVEYGASMPRPADSPSRAATIFDSLWERTDSLVAGGALQRTWVWGQPLDDVRQFNAADGGDRYERLYEKGRMEINNPYSLMDSGWYITPGRLAAELIEGGASIPLAGDLDVAGPTYRHLRNVSWKPQAAGTPISRWLSSGGHFVDRQAMAKYGVVAGMTYKETGLAVASVFEDYLSQSGPVVEGGEVTRGPLFDPPLLAIGFPVTEPFWITVSENDVYVDVLVQCFERRCLTYTPSHEPAWRIEMSNIGTHYQLWQAAPARFASADGPAAPARQGHRTWPW